jgi:hypothetical protein
MIAYVFHCNDKMLKVDNILVVNFGLKTRTYNVSLML